MAGQTAFSRDRVVSIDYNNWRGESSRREIVPYRIWFGSTAWHPEPQWLLDAFDVEKEAQRDFAMSEIRGFFGETGGDVLSRSPVKGTAG